MSARKGAKRPSRSGRSLDPSERRVGDEQAVMLRVWLPESLVEALDELAAREGSTRTELTGLALMAMLARRGALPAPRHAGC